MLEGAKKAVIINNHYRYKISKSDEILNNDSSIDYKFSYLFCTNHITIKSGKESNSNNKMNSDFIE